MKIHTIPDPILHQKSKPVQKIDEKIKKLALEMIKMIRGSRKTGRVGVGLSAVQIGQLKRLFVIWDPENKKDFVFINPKIFWRSKKLTKKIPGKFFKYEGCLCLPGYWGLVKRNWAIRLKYQTLAGEKKEKRFAGFLATVIQHEIDHLDGILFIDRILEQKGKIYKAEKSKNGQEELIEIKL